MTIVRTMMTILAGASIAFPMEIGWAAEQFGPGVATRKLRSATQCRTADLLPLTASSERPRPPISTCSMSKAV